MHTFSGFIQSDSRGRIGLQKWVRPYALRHYKVSVSDDGRSLLIELQDA